MVTDQFGQGDAHNHTGTIGSIGHYRSIEGNSEILKDSEILTLATGKASCCMVSSSGVEQ